MQDHKVNICMKQLGNMVSSLKRKFQENEMKIGHGDDESLAFSKPNDKKMFELSKMIWGKTSTLHLNKPLYYCIWLCWDFFILPLNIERMQQF